MMNRGPGRSHWNTRGGSIGGGRSWNGQRSSSSNTTSSNNQFTNRHDGGGGRSQSSTNRSFGRSSSQYQQRRPYFNNNNRRNNSSRTYGPQSQIDDFDRIEEIGSPITGKTISIAIEGCCHGQITTIYDRLRKYEEDENAGGSDELVLAQDAVDGAPDTNNGHANALNLKKRRKIDLLICCGDFQSIRTPADFHSLAVPAKYREMGSFYKYYNQEWVAPILTIFCGGNHEASQPLSELYYGGWVAPNIYYLGAAGVVRYKGIRIGGLSGIYKSHDHYQPRTEIPPYDPKQLRSVYHYRNVDVYRLSCLRRYDNDTSSLSTDNCDLRTNQSSKRLDIMVSHDWPQGIEQYGDVNDLIRRKPFFREEVQENTLGSPPAAHLLHTLQPSYWFAAHLHVKFHAKVIHKKVNTTTTHSPPSPASMLIPSQVIRTNASRAQKSIDLSANEHRDESTDKELTSPSTNEVVGDTVDTVADAKTQEHPTATTHFHVPESSLCSSTTPDLTELMTQFLSLDKCLPRRQYLSIVHIPADPVYNVPDNTTKIESDSGLPKLEYDLEWLAIIRKTHHLASLMNPCRDINKLESHIVSNDDITWVRERIGTDISIPENFVPTLNPKYDGHDWRSNRTPPPPLPRMGNPQTDQLLELLQLEHLPNVTIPYNSASESQYVVQATPPPPQVRQQPLVFEHDDNEIDLDDNADIAVDTRYNNSGIAESDDIHRNDNNNEKKFTLQRQDMKKPRLNE